MPRRDRGYRPGAIALATYFRVDDVQSRLASEVLKILYTEVKRGSKSSKREGASARQARPLRVLERYMGQEGKRKLGNPSIGESDLPASLYGKTRDSHPVWGTSGAWGHALVGHEILVARTRAPGELDNEAFAHEVGSIYAGQAGGNPVDATCDIRKAATKVSA